MWNLEDDRPYLAVTLDGYFIMLAGLYLEFFPCSM
jgi:hypothetical protein